MRSFFVKHGSQQQALLVNSQLKMFEVSLIVQITAALTFASALVSPNSRFNYLWWMSMSEGFTYFFLQNILCECLNECWLIFLPRYDLGGKRLASRQSPKQND